MGISVRSDTGGRSVVSVSGDLDLASAPDLRERGEGEAASPACRELVIDLSEVRFIDSTGLGALIGIRNRAVAAAVGLSLRNPAPRVVEVLELAGLSRVFTVDAEPLPGDGDE